MMEKVEVERTIKVPVIRFDDGTEIDVSVIRNFLSEAYDYKGTIGQDGNYMDGFLYFPSEEEKKLETVLERLDVIRKSPQHAYHNDKVGKVEHYDNYRYWLSDGYHKFSEDFWDLLG